MIQSNIKLKGEPSAQALASGLATLGRYGDNYMVHAAEGETFVPKEILDANPDLKNQLFNQMKSMGIEEPNRYVVGDALNSINPVTGQPEFFFKKIFRAVKKVFKKVLPIAAPIIGNFIAPGIGGIIASGLVTKMQGGSWGDALKSAGLSYVGGAAMRGIQGGIGTLGTDASFFGGVGGGLQDGLIQPFQAANNMFISGPNNPLSQGVFGGIGSDSGMLNNQYFTNIDNAKGFMNTAGKILGPSYNPNAAGTEAVGESVSISEAKNAAILNQSPDGKIPIAPSGPAASTAVAEPDFFSKAGAKKFLQSNLGSNMAVAAGAGALAYITAPDPASDEEIRAKLGPASAELKAYDQYRAGRSANPGFGNTPEGQDLLRKAGLTPTRNATQLASSTGVGIDAANRFMQSRYGTPPSGIQMSAVGGSSPIQLGGGMPPGLMAAAGGEITGPGSGTSDSIPAMLSDGEFVMTAQAVRNAGNGNRDLGAARMYDMMSKFERAV